MLHAYSPRTRKWIDYGLPSRILPPYTELRSGCKTEEACYQGNENIFPPKMLHDLCAPGVPFHYLHFLQGRVT